MVVPAIIKQLDPGIYKTAMRAEQLHSVKPIIAYWCNVRSMQQILAHRKEETDGNKEKVTLLENRNHQNADAEDVQMIHTWSGDQEIEKYAEVILGSLESFKETHGEEKAVVEDEIAQLYIEQFAQETLDRAQRVVNANKVTATTANTFDAAATFFGLVNIWDAPDPETLRKIKYAKWNARRILKAYKDGLDPNDSNPKPEDLPEDITAQEDSFAQDGGISPSAELPGAPANVPRPATIEDDLEHSQSLRPAEQHTRRDSAGVSLPHSPASSVSGHGGTANSGTAVPGSPPVQDPSQLPSAPTHSADTPSFVDSVSPTLPSLTPGTAPVGMFDSPPLSLSSEPSAPPSYQNIPPVNPPSFAPSSHSTAAVASPPPPSAYTGYGAAPPQSYTPPAGYPPATAYNRAVAQPPAHPARPSPATYSQPPPAPPPKAHIDDAAIAAAQKHAKWAISALNFEDVPTAVRELRRALQQLGES
ncbi:hypothetical protein F503_07285 [Ophiostoma piceae UAMH 11346]|uniref:Uncharacterized protein n=1 Tax=Ophiostoma piceae (strain UAMH 11346) TaxID=1262450 RepID=S3C7K4_OPHP1|nr:hypothetical protein F503_07285 [Ophiostoma piceae UAMH 11346]